MMDGANIKAWGVEINSMTCIVFATTLPKARYIAVLGYWDAFGRRKGEWPRAVGWREPRFDTSPLIAHGKKGPFTRDYVEGYPSRNDDCNVGSRWQDA